MRTLMEVALLNYLCMIVAPLLYPASETPEAFQAEAHGLIKMVFDVDHKSIRHLSLRPKASSLRGSKYSKNFSLSLTHSASLKEAMLNL